MAGLASRVRQLTYGLLAVTPRSIADGALLAPEIILRAVFSPWGALVLVRFQPDPFGGKGGRLYRTGDKAMRWADGSVDYLGRLDAQVKIRGFRIELGEIEARLVAEPGVEQATVIVRNDGGGPQLIAYVVANGDGYLAVVLDWFSRRVLSWRVSITMEADFCVAALEEALARHGKPEISARCGASSRQHRPRQPVHGQCVHRRAEGA